MRIFVAIPCYDARVGIETARALLNEQCTAVSGGDDFKVVFLPGCSLVTIGRNQLVDDFLKSDSDRLVFIDSDVSWEPGSIVKIAHHPADVVGGAYRYKSDDENYPVGWIPGELWANDHGLIEVESLPAGFLAINKSVFYRLKEANPARRYTHMGHQAHCFFHAPFADGKMYGEDAAFCADWRAIGGKIYLDPELTLTHTGGQRSYTGNIGSWLKSR